MLVCVKLDDGWQDAVPRALASEGPRPDNTMERGRIEAAMANLRKQHLWGAVSDEVFKAEFRELSRQLRILEPEPVKGLAQDLERAARLLSGLPALWRHSGVTPGKRRELAREVFEEIRLREGKLVAVKPRPQYAPLFAYSVWRQNVVGGAKLS